MGYVTTEKLASAGESNGPGIVYVNKTFPFKLL